MKRIITTAVVGLSLVAFAGAQDAGSGSDQGRGKRKGCTEVREVRQENGRQLREHYKEQKAENKAFRNSLKDMAPDARIDAIIDHRNEQYAENVALHDALHNALVAAIEACDEIPADKKAELLQQIRERHQEATDFHAGIHHDTIAFLTELKGADMTPEEKQEAWKQFRKEVQAKLKAWREEHRRGGRGRGNAAE